MRKRIKTVTPKKGCQRITFDAPDSIASPIRTIAVREGISMADVIRGILKSAPLIVKEQDEIA